MTTRNALLGLLALTGLASCRKDEVEVRRLPKENTSVGMAAPAAMSAGGESPRPKGVRWTAPAGWTEHGANGMRVASFELPKGPGKAEVTVVALPGDAGGELANVNRWRGQIALPPMAPTDLTNAKTMLKSAAGEIALYDFTSGGTAKSRLIAGTLNVSGTTWFFKLMGEEKAVAAAKPAFLQLLKGLRSDGA